MGFSARLAVTLALTLALVAGLGYKVVTREVQRRVVAQEAAYQGAQADALEAISRGKSWRAALPQIRKLIDVAAQRPGTQETLLIDSRFRVVDAQVDALVGRPDGDPRISAALEHRAAYAGREADGTRDTRDFEFVTPLRLPGGRFALEASYDHAFFDHELASLRSSIALVTLLGLFAGGLAFYLLGGRSLARMHRVALQRATLDGLTGLANQRAFHDDLERDVALATRHGEPLALALIDLDDFRFLNDRLGHTHGDDLLLRVARTLRDGRVSDRAFRVGGDEFALLLARTDLDSAKVTLARLQRRLAEVEVPVSVGVSSLRPGEDTESLREEADAALLEAKRRGGGGLLVFEDIRDSVAITTGPKLAALHRLLADRDLTVAFQPIWDLESGTLLGVEALARPAAGYGFSGPAEAFDIAEQAGRVQELDTLCVETALAQAHELPDGALLFVNIAPRTLDLDALGDGWLLEAIERSPIDAGQVVIEVTERFGGRLSSVLESLQRLRNGGIKLALDDVGTGNAGLEMLSRVDVDFVKIDRSVVAAARTEPGARAVLLSMATFANETGSYVIAEGIEDERLLAFLRGLEHDRTVARPRISGGQGYGLGRPNTSMPDTFTVPIVGYRSQTAV